MASKVVIATGASSGLVGLAPRNRGGCSGRLACIRMRLSAPSRAPSPSFSAAAPPV